MASYSSCMSGEVNKKSAVALSQAIGILYVTATLSNAFTSGSCGCASMVSQKKISTSILPSAMFAPTCGRRPMVR